MEQRFSLPLVGQAKKHTSEKKRGETGVWMPLDEAKSEGLYIRIKADNDK